MVLLDAEVTHWVLCKSANLPPNTSEFFNFSDTLILTPVPKAPTSLRIPEQKL